MDKYESEHQKIFERTKRAMSILHKSELETLHKILSEYKCAENKDKFLSLQNNMYLYTMLYIVSNLVTKKRK